MQCRTFHVIPNNCKWNDLSALYYKKCVYNSSLLPTKCENLNCMRSMKSEFVEWLIVKQIREYKYGWYMNDVSFGVLFYCDKDYSHNNMSNIPSFIKLVNFSFKFRYRTSLNQWGRWLQNSSFFKSISVYWFLITKLLRTYNTSCL